MNSEESPGSLLENVPQPNVRHKSRMDLVWLIPIVAALIAAGLAVKAITEKGPTITISFSSAEGLEAGKTRIKYKDVDVGKVKHIQLSGDLTHVVVNAEMVPEIAPFLTGRTRFWVVRARVTASQISGLGTLFTGVYIGMDPGKEQGPSARHFEGLKSPPVVTMDMPGRQFHLRADRLGSLDIGSPVYSRQIKVGQVVNYHMNDDETAVDVQIFIQAPHDQRITKQTRFWNASGLDVRLDTKGIQINTESMITLFSGGIAFETPANVMSTAPPGAHDVFKLYNSHDQIDEPIYTRKVNFIAYFQDTVRGLSVGAPVEFRGIKVGTVTDLKLQFDPRTLSFRVPVLLTIEPERFSVIGQEQASEEGLVDKLIRKGLRAQLRTGLLLTGQLYVNLDFFPEAPPPGPARKGAYPVLPTVSAPVEEITASVANLLSRLEKLPIEQIGRDVQSSVGRIRTLLDSKDLQAAVAALNQSLANLEVFSGQLNRTTAPQLSAVLQETRSTLAQARKSLAATDRFLSDDAPMSNELQQTLKELSKAARSVGALADYLERHPEAFIYGKGSAQ
jgi:paraquat-inducible protein B